MIDRLVRGLASGSQLSAEEILDVLWLASAHPAAGETGPAPPAAPPEEQLVIPNGPPPPPPEAPDEDEAPVPLRLEGRERPGARERVAAREVAFAAPGPILDVLAMPRALRRFAQVRAPGRELSVDIEATVDATAEAGRLMAVFARREERGLDLVLVVDGSSPMRIWGDTFDAFEALAAQSGAFRSVSRWRLADRGGEARVEDPVTGILQSPRRLVDPSGRRVVLVATDASHEWWYTGAPWEAVAIWCAAMPTALVQVLPPHYWSATAVGTPYVTARARRPAGPNAEYTRRLAWWAADPGGVTLPVMTLTPQSLEAWARAAVSGTSWAAGITATPPEPEYAPSAVADGDPDVLVNSFLSRASAGAERLARVLATAGRLSLPLIAVLQEELAPATGVPELAEIMAGGLLEEAGASAFRFRAGTREILRRGATAFDEWDAHSAVSRYLEERQRIGGRLRALIPDPGGSAVMDAEEAPFADLRQALAARLGLRPAVESAPGPSPATAAAEPEETPAGEVISEAELADAIAAEVEALDDSRTLIIAEYQADYLVTRTISRDPAGTPHSSSRVTSAEDHLTLPAGAGYRALLVCTASATPSVARFWRLARIRYPQITAVQCPTQNLYGVIDEAIANSPLTQPYNLVILPGRLDLIPPLLFGPGARRGDVRSLTVECLPSDDRGTVFGVIAGYGTPDVLEAVQLQSAILNPGTYEITAELLRPGEVRIGGLPVSFHKDSRVWPEIATAIPRPIDDPAPVHLILAIETDDDLGLVTRRFERARNLIAAMSRGGRSARFSVIHYGAHSFRRGIVDQYPSVAAWAAPATAIESALRPPGNVPMAHSPAKAAQLECALALIADRLIGSADGRPVLVTLGSRPAYPSRMDDPVSQVLPCPNRNDWRAALMRLERTSEIFFGAIQDGDSSAEIWNKLGRHAHARLDTVDIERFAAELGLLTHERQPVPIPVLVTSPASEPAADEAVGTALEQAAEELPWEREPVAVSPVPGNSIALFGPPSSGKTTFAAALAVALGRHPDEPWRLRGVDRRSSDALGGIRDTLIDQGEFPSATRNTADYDWQLVKSDLGAGRRGLFGLPRRDRTERVPLHLVDGSGGYQNPANWDNRSGSGKFVEEMASCSGFVFLYDPVLEARQGDAFQRTSRLLARLDASLGGGKDGYLPQYLAVCVTKFDDPRVYASAKAANLVDYDYAGDGSPYVDPDHAEEFFERMCLASPNPVTRELLPLLRRHFHPRRIKFYVTSAVGFYMNPGTGRFDDADFENVIREPGKLPMLRGPIRPLNIMEPVLWQAQQISGKQRG